MNELDTKRDLAAMCVKDELAPIFTDIDTIINGVGMDIDAATLIGSSINNREFGLDDEATYVIADVIENDCGIVLVVNDSDGRGYALSTIDFEDEYHDFAQIAHNQEQDFAGFQR
jgi:hypothetical protein